MDIQEHFSKMKVIQYSILQYIEKVSNVEENFQNLNTLIYNYKIKGNKHEVKLFLNLISKISKNHFRSTDFFHKITKILLIFKTEIKSNFTNSEIFSIFKNNKRLFLFFIQEKIITIDKPIAQKILNRKYQDENYPFYFFPEIEEFTEKLMKKKFQKYEDNFEYERKIAENDEPICEIIRNDSVNSFKSYMQSKKMNLTSIIEKSVFETNSYLIKNQPTLIEYAAFFGSINIFKYLYSKNIKVNQSIWPYVIHGNNFELINFLRQNKIEIDHRNFDKCLKESIKCHHTEITYYLLKNIQNKGINESKINENFLDYCFHYYNFSFIQDFSDDKLIFNYLCKYGYYTLVELYVKHKPASIMNKTIQKKKKFFFLMKFQKKIFF